MIAPAGSGDEVAAGARPVGAIDVVAQAEVPGRRTITHRIGVAIVLPDPDIAPQHAMLTGDGVSFNLKDMSLSGTFINSRKVERVQLSNGQKIRMGNTELVYHERR